MIEQYPLGRVAEAYEQMTSGRVRFRVVLTFDGVPAVTNNKQRWKRHTKVAIKHGFEGAGAHRGMKWIASVRIGFTSWRTVPLLFSSCLALIGALERDAQKPFCYAS